MPARVEVTLPKKWTHRRKLVFVVEEFTMARKKTRRRLSDEFKAETVKRVKQSNRSMADLAMEHGINAGSIGEWVRKSEESHQSIEEDERVELRRLHK